MKVFVSLLICLSLKIVTAAINTVCRKQMMNEFGFEGLDRPIKQRTIFCPDVEYKCCPFEDELKFKVNWASNLKTRHDNSFKYLTNEFKDFVKRFQFAQKIKYETYPKLFKPSGKAVVPGLIEELNKIVESDINGYAKPLEAVQKDDMDNKYRFMCFLCDATNHLKITEIDQRVNLSSDYCTSILDKYSDFLKIKILKMDYVAVRMLKIASQFVSSESDLDPYIANIPNMEKTIQEAEICLTDAKPVKSKCKSLCETISISDFSATLIGHFKMYTSINKAYTKIEAIIEKRKQAKKMNAAILKARKEEAANPELKKEGEAAKKGAETPKPAKGTTTASNKRSRKLIGQHYRPALKKQTRRSTKHYNRRALRTIRRRNHGFRPRILESRKASTVQLLRKLKKIDKSVRTYKHQMKRIKKKNRKMIKKIMKMHHKISKKMKTPTYPMQNQYSSPQTPYNYITQPQQYQTYTGNNMLMNQQPQYSQLIQPINGAGYYPRESIGAPVLNAPMPVTYEQPPMKRLRHHHRSLRRRIHRNNAYRDSEIDYENYERPRMRKSRHQMKRKLAKGGGKGSTSNTSTPKPSGGGNKSTTTNAKPSTESTSKNNKKVSSTTEATNVESLRISPSKEENPVASVANINQVSEAEGDKKDKGSSNTPQVKSGAKLEKESKQTKDQTGNSEPKSQTPSSKPQKDVKAASDSTPKVENNTPASQAAKKKSQAPASENAKPKPKGKEAINMEASTAANQNGQTEKPPKKNEVNCPEPPKLDVTLELLKRNFDIVRLFTYNLILNKTQSWNETEASRNTNRFFDGSPLIDYYSGFKDNGVNITSYTISNLTNETTEVILARIKEIESKTPNADSKLSDIKNPAILNLVNTFSDNDFFEFDNDCEIVIGGLNQQPSMGKYVVGVLAEEAAKEKAKKPEEKAAGDKKKSGAKTNNPSTPTPAPNPKRKLQSDRKRHGIRRWSI